MSRYDRQKADLLESGMDEKCANFWTGTARAQREAMRKRGQHVPRDKYSAPKRAADDLSEHQIQAAFITRCLRESEKIPELSRWFAIPNGGNRDQITAARLKYEGARRGVPDLFLPVARNGLHGLFIEMKKPGEKTSDAQKFEIPALRNHGYRVEICYTAETAWEVTMDYLRDARPAVSRQHESAS